MINKAEILDRYLPLGSIVLIRGNVKKLMIVARGVITGKEPNRKVFDYGAVLYPEGMMDDRIIFFNQKDIFQVVVEGYTDSDDQIMNENIRNWLKEVNEHGDNRQRSNS